MHACEMHAYEIFKDKSSAYFLGVHLLWAYIRTGRHTNVSHHLLGTTTCSAPFVEGYPGAFIIITQRIGLWDLYKYV